MAEQEKKLRGLLQDFNHGMLVTVSKDGQLNARPMVLADVESDNDVFFITNVDSAKVDELEGDSRVCVTCQSGNRFVALTGMATIEQDPSKIDACWKESWKVWFPEGKSSPDLRLIHVVSLAGEYWDNSGLQGVKYLLKAGKAYAAGEKPSLDDEMHAKVRLT